MKRGSSVCLSRVHWLLSEQFYFPVRAENWLLENNFHPAEGCLSRKNSSRKKKDTGGIEHLVHLSSGVYRARIIFLYPFLFSCLLRRCLLSHFRTPPYLN